MAAEDNEGKEQLKKLIALLEKTNKRKLEEVEELKAMLREAQTSYSNSKNQLEEKIEELQFLDYYSKMKTEKEYGLGDTPVKSRGSHYSLYCNSTSMRGPSTVLEIKSHNKGDRIEYLEYMGEKSIPVNEINWKKAVAIIKFYNLENYKEFIEIFDHTTQFKDSTDLSVTLYDCSVSFNVEFNNLNTLEKRGTNKLYKFFINYFK